MALGSAKIEILFRMRPLFDTEDWSPATPDARRWLLRPAAGRIDKSGLVGSGEVGGGKSRPWGTKA